MGEETNEFFAHAKKKKKKNAHKNNMIEYFMCMRMCRCNACLCARACNSDYHNSNGGKNPERINLVLVVPLLLLLYSKEFCR